MNSKKILTLCLGMVFIISLITLLFSFTAKAESEITTSVFLDNNETYITIERPVSVTENTNKLNETNYKNIYVADEAQNKIFVLDKYMKYVKDINITKTPKKLAFYSDSLYILCSDNKLYTLNITLEEFQEAKILEDSLVSNASIKDFCISNNTLAIVKEHEILRFDLTNNTLSNTITDEDTILSVALADNEEIGTIKTYYLTQDNNEQRYIKVTDLESLQITGISVSPSPDLTIAYSNGKLYLKEVKEIAIWQYDKENDTFPTNETKGYDDLKINEIRALYIADDYYLILNISRHAVIKYDKNFNYVNSYSSGFEDDGKFVNPKQIAEKNGNVYVLDNSRIQTFSENSRDLLRLDDFGLITSNNVKSFAVTNDNKFYVMESNKLHIINSEHDITTIQKNYSTLADIATTLDNKVFLLDSKNKEIICIENNEAKTFLYDIQAKKIATNIKDKILYILTESGSIEAYSTETKQKLFGMSHNLTNVIDFEIDFTSNIFILSKDTDKFVVTKIDGESLESKGMTLKTIEGSTKIDNLTSIAINNTNGDLMFTDNTCHKVFLASKELSNVTTMTDIPNLELPFDITNATYNNKVTVGIVKAFPSTLFYPPHTDANCNINYVNSGIVTLEENKEVLILDEQKNFYYVLVDGNVGFIYKNAVEIKPNSTPVVFKGKIRDANTAIFSLPSSKAINHENAFQIVENGKKVTLNEGTEVLVLGNVFNYTDANNISYYLIEIDGKNAYINSQRIYEPTETTSNNFKMARVSTGINSGETPIYAVMDITSTPIGMLKDNDMVKVYSVTNGFAYITVTDENGQTLSGYIKNEFLVYNGLSTNQIIIISVISGIVLLFITSLILIKVIKRKKV